MLIKYFVHFLHVHYCYLNQYPLIFLKFCFSSNTKHAFTVHSLIFHVSHIHTDMPTSHIICISSDFLSYLRLSSFQFFTFLLSTISFFQIHTQFLFEVWLFRRIHATLILFIYSPHFSNYNNYTVYIMIFSITHNSFFITFDTLFYAFSQSLV